MIFVVHQLSLSLASCLIPEAWFPGGPKRERERKGLLRACYEASVYDYVESCLYRVFIVQYSARAWTLYPSQSCKPPQGNGRGTSRKGTEKTDVSQLLRKFTNLTFRFEFCYRE